MEDGKMFREAGCAFVAENGIGCFNNLITSAVI
jgi:hypothetical protein